jgi:hypothetical protein
MHLENSWWGWTISVCIVGSCILNAWVFLHDLRKDRRERVCENRSLLAARDPGQEDIAK